MVRVLQNWMIPTIFTLVFHRILDFKTGLNIYSDPFIFLDTFPLTLASKKSPAEAGPLFTNP
jgi:hypothetical protein